MRIKHCYPELTEPAISETAAKASPGAAADGSANVPEPVAMEIKNKRIVVNAAFLRRAAEVIPAACALEAVLDHGVAHYTYCPWDFHTHLVLHSEAKKVLKNADMAATATERFMDVVADTHCYKEKASPLPQLYRGLERGVLDEAMHALYQKIWGEDLGVHGYEHIARRLSRLRYLDRQSWPESLARFCKIIRELLESEQDSGRLSEPNPMGPSDLGRYSPQEIDQGLKQFAMGAAGPQAFKDVVEDFEEELQEAALDKDTGMGLGGGSALDANLLYYMKLAENYALPVRKMPMEKSGSRYPYGHSPWEVGKPFRDIDPWTSLGKFMPGITQIWEKREGETVGEEERVPDCLVMIDSSGSMTNPREKLSYAVLGAACAADAYLRQGARVAVYNFSDTETGGKLVLDYTRDRKPVYQALCRYFGGGTRLSVGDIGAFQQSRPADIFLITDMQITNLEDLLACFEKLENRITAVHIGDNDQVTQFKDRMSNRRGLSLFPVRQRQDIPRIVLGKLEEYFRSV